MRSLNRILFDANEVSAGDRVVLRESDHRAVHIRQVLQQGGGEPADLSKVRTCMYMHPPSTLCCAGGVRCRVAKPWWRVVNVFVVNAWVASIRYGRCCCDCVRWATHCSW